MHHILSPSEVLYKHIKVLHILQVGMKTVYNGPQGQLSIFFGNKSPYTLEQVVCNFPPSPQFQWQTGALPRSIESKKQTMVRKSFEYSFLTLNSLHIHSQREGGNPFSWQKL